MFRSQTDRLGMRIGLLLFACIALVSLGFPQDTSAARGVRAGIYVGAGDYDYLAEYGEWMELEDFGLVWHPYVVAEWEPFFHGHWSWTNDGWAWISYEPFGWLVFHYGYWYFDYDIGWFWVPGRIWSPARVQWYTYGDYCAWAPLPPPNHHWRNPWDRHDFNVWVVVNINHFTDEDIGRHRIAEPFHRDIARRDVWASRAPDIRRVERGTQREIPRVRISKERADLRPKAPAAPSRYYRSREIQTKRMVLPEQELNRVRQYAPRVEREVLTPPKNAPREPQRPTERKTEQMQRRKVRSR